MQALYLQHAQIQAASPYQATDILGALRDLDAQVYLSTVYLKNNLLVAAPSGRAGVFVAPGGYDSIDSGRGNVYGPANFLPGHSLGIVVGTDSTLPTPTDRGMIAPVFHGKGGTVAGGTVMEGYTTGDNASLQAYGATYYGGALFVPLRGFNLTSVRLKMYRTGSPGILTISIRGMRYQGETLSTEQNDIVSGTTDGDTLTTSTSGEWRETTMSPSLYVYPGHIYTIMVQAPTGNDVNRVNVRYASGVAHPRYGIWTRAGASYTGAQTSVTLFEAKGGANPEMEYGGCEIFNEVISNPNGEFSIRRLLSNNSGSSITVRECGIYAAITRYIAAQPVAGQSFALCVARDVVAPAIDVDHGEVLGVTYTPQVTV